MNLNNGGGIYPPNNDYVRRGFVLASLGNAKFQLMELQTITDNRECNEYINYSLVNLTKAMDLMQTGINQFLERGSQYE